MALINRSLGRRKDWPQLEAAAVGGLAAGSATDPAQDTFICAVPELRYSFNGGAGMGAFSGYGSMVTNHMSVRVASFISTAAAVTNGNATNNADMRINLYRLGALQGCLAYLSLTANTTINTTAVTSGSMQTVTPASMVGIVTGTPLLVGSGATQELVYVQGATSTTFNAFFQYNHPTTDALITALIPYRPINFIMANSVLSTTSVTTITAGTRAVTPASMYGIHLGDYLTFSGGTGATETVQVTAMTASTFTALFVNGHSGGYTIVAGSSPLVGNNFATSPNVPYEIRGGDVLTFSRLSNNATGLATPAGSIQIEWVPNEVLS